MRALNRYLDILLDTTPRQWGQSVAAGFSGLDFCLDRMTRIFIVTSVALHVASVAALGIWGKINALPSAKQVVEVEFGEVNAVRPERPGDAGFDQNSDIVMAVSKKKAQQVDTATRRLLEKYKNMRVAGLNGGIKAQGLSLQGQNAKATAQDYADEDKGKEAWLKHLASYQNRLQTCYESALLADSMLSGKLRFVLRTDSAGRVAESDISFLGAGMPGTKNSLIKCLKSVVTAVQFPNEMRGAFNRRIGFEAVLSL